MPSPNDENLTTPPLSTNVARLRRRLVREVSHAIDDYHMIEDGDVILACVSGGKDSYTMLDMLLHLQKRAPVHFDIIAMNLDQGQPGFPKEVMPAYFKRKGIAYHIETEDTYSVVKDKIPDGKTTCSLCSRLRRAVIYRVAKQWGANKVALGHHRDDIVETLFLNIFFGGKLKAMPPKLISDDKQHVLIRPLAYCSENDIARFARAMDYPIIPCNLCGSQENLQRKQIKHMLQSWEEQYPGRVKNIFRAIRHVSRSHLADPELYDFKGLTTEPIGLVDLLALGSSQ